MQSFIIKQVLSTIPRKDDETPKEYYDRLIKEYKSLISDSHKTETQSNLIPENVIL